MASFADLKAARASRHRLDSSTSRTPNPPSSSSFASITAQDAPLDASSSTSPYPNAGIYNLPSTLSVRTHPKRGRGIYSTKSFKPGSTIVSTQARVAVLPTSHLSSECTNCHLTPFDISIQSGTGDGGKGRSLKRCTGCRVVYYCSAACQKTDWQTHKPECQAHKRLKATYPGTREDGWIMPESVRALGRLCWDRKRVREVGGRDPDWWTEVEAMESHLKRLPEEQVVKLGEQVQVLRRYLSCANPSGNEVDMADFGFASSAELLNLVSALQVNSFTLSSPSLSPLGVAMSPSIALFNHSCEPNAVVVFPHGKGEMRVVSISQIDANEEILTSYIDVSLPRLERRKELKERYGFDCDCTLCRKEEEKEGEGEGWVDPRWCVLHTGCVPGKGKSKGKAAMPDLSMASPCERVCDACHENFVVDVRILSKLIEQGKGILRDDEAGTLDPQNATNQLSSLLPHLLHLTPPSSHPTLALCRLHSQSLISSSPPRTSVNSYQLAIQSIALAYRGAEQVYPPGHPTLGIILAEWGKLLLAEGTGEMVERLGQGLVVLRKCSEALARGFGSGGGIVGREVEGLVRGCEGELGVLRRAGM